MEADRGLNAPAQEERDPLERHLNPPPPSGLRERLAQRRGALLGALGVMAAIVLAAVGFLLLSGDGKGSGDFERAFGRLSEQDELHATDVGHHQTGALNGILGMIESTGRGELQSG